MLICAPRTAQLLNNEIQKAEEQNLPIIPLPRAGGVGWVYSSPQKSLRRTGPIAKYNNNERNPPRRISFINFSPAAKSVTRQSCTSLAKQTSLRRRRYNTPNRTRRAWIYFPRRLRTPSVQFTSTNQLLVFHESDFSIEFHSAIVPEKLITASPFW